MWKNGMRSVVIGRMPFFVLCSIFFAGWLEENVDNTYNSLELRRRRHSPEKSGKPQNVLRRGPARGRTPILLTLSSGEDSFNRRRRQHTYSDLQIPPLVLYLLYNEQEG